MVCLFPGQNLHQWKISKITERIFWNIWSEICGSGQVVVADEVVPFIMDHADDDSVSSQVSNIQRLLAVSQTTTSAESSSGATQPARQRQRQRQNLGCARRGPKRSKIKLKMYHPPDIARLPTKMTYHNPIVKGHIQSGHGFQGPFWDRENKMGKFTSLFISNNRSYFCRFISTVFTKLEGPFHLYRQTRGKNYPFCLLDPHAS